MKVKLKRWIPILLSACLLGLTVALSTIPQPQPPVTKPVSATADEVDADMRGVWVTYMELSMEYETDKSERAFREKFERIAAVAKNAGFNALIVQVRPFCDALYDSEAFPASHVLSGKQGEKPGYDALEIMCETGKRLGLAIHAWLNPYRVTANNVPETLSESNPYRQHPDWCIETDSGIILDPSNENARKLIENGVREIIENYDVAGIQFDDYFYPPDIGDLDNDTYNAYLQTDIPVKMNRADWRELNVNILLSEIYMLVHSSGKPVVFGISPQGNLGNNESLSADVVSWCCVHGFADYLCPQLYFSLNNPALGFEDALDEWCALDRAKDVKLYIGLAGYKARTDADEGTWLDREDILAEEFNILKKNQKVDGVMLYSYSSLIDEEKAAEIKSLSELLQ